MPASCLAEWDKPAVRILFLTDCSTYSDWQSIALAYSYMYSNHKGPITRVMCCSEEDRKAYSKEMLDFVETHIAPSYTVHPRTGDAYLAYNKPEAVIDYLQHVTPEEEWLVVLDSDMIVRKPWQVKDFNLSLGWAVGSNYGYLQGVINDLAERHIPEITKRNDNFAGPSGRRSDQVGGFFFIHRDDMKRLSPLWLKYTEDVRADPEAYHLTGDVYATKPGMKPWIAEMYGYSFGAAKANVWHHGDEHSMLYPGYTPGGIPKVLHIGLEWEVQGFKFDKHWYTSFTPFKCPPWDLTPKNPQEGLFPHPPRPKELTAKLFIERYRDLISVEAVAALNAGLCFWYRRRCPSSEQLEKECSKAEQIYFETKEALQLAEDNWQCVNFSEECEGWAKRGECTSQFKGYMAANCRPACGYCKAQSAETAKNILKMLNDVKGVRPQPQPIYGAKDQFNVLVPWPKPDNAEHKDAIEGSGQTQQKVAPAADKTTATTTATATDTAAKAADVAKAATTNPEAAVQITVDQGASTKEQATATTTTTSAKTEVQTATTTPTQTTSDAQAAKQQTTSADSVATTAQQAAITTKATTATTTTAASSVVADSSDNKVTSSTTEVKAADAPTKAKPAVENPVFDATKITTATLAADDTKKIEDTSQKAANTPAMDPAATTTTAAKDTGSAQIAAEPLRPERLKELLRRCYHMSTASIAEVKECVSAAKEGVEWTKPDHPTVHAHDLTHNSWRKRGPVETPVMRRKTASDEGRGAAHLHPAAAVGYSLPSIKTNGQSGHSNFMWQFFGFWGVVVTVYAVPMYLRRRKRVYAGRTQRQLAE